MGDLVYIIEKDSLVGDAKWTMGMEEKANKGRMESYERWRSSTAMLLKRLYL